MRPIHADAAAEGEVPDEISAGGGAASGVMGDRLPLLLLPGTLCDVRVFGPLLDRLDRRRMFALPAIREASTRAQAEALLRDAPPRFALLGFSLGGIVALEVAALAPERVAGLALIGANARPVPAQDHSSRRAELRDAIAMGAGNYVRERLWPSYVGRAARDDAALRDLIADMAECAGPDAFASQIEVALSRTDSLPRLPGLDMPVLLLAGEADALAPPALQHEMADALPDAMLALLPGTGHFAPLEQPDAVAGHVRQWLDQIDANVGNVGNVNQHRVNNQASGGLMSETGVQSIDNPDARIVDDPRAVLQVERRDFTQLVPEDRPRVQSMRGFDDCYTDIVDYIIRCTHKIWDERDVGLIYSHYTHNCVLYGVLGTVYERETVVRETIQRLVELPDRRGMATQVIWRGNDVDGFYTSHMTHGTGRHTEYGMWGKPTGRTFVTRTVADCMILENKIYKEWVVRDNMAQLVQLGIDPQEYADKLARQKFERGETVLDISENRRLLGQYPPEAEADVSIAHSENEAQLLRWLHHIYNKRMFGKIQEIYAPTCQWHGPLMRELYGIPAVLQQTMRLVALMPDCAYVPQHICSIASEEGGEKIAVRWMLDGHHLGYGALGVPTGHHLSVMGVTHYHIIDGKIVDEWVLYDELSMLVQIKLAALQAAA